MDFGLSDEFRAPRRPKFLVAFDIRHAKVQKDAKNICIARRRSDDFRLVIRRTATAVDREPNIAEREGDLGTQLRP
jgi:hypothetical protein